MLAAEVRIDNEDLDKVSWEQTSVRSLTDSPTGLIDADVTSGSLDDLAGTATIAQRARQILAVP